MSSRQAIKLNIEQSITYQWLAYFGNTTGPLMVPDPSMVRSIIFSLWTTDHLGSLVQSKIGLVWRSAIFGPDRSNTTSDAY